MTVNSSALQAVEWCNPSTSCYGFCRSIAITASGDGRQRSKVKVKRCVCVCVCVSACVCVCMCVLDHWYVFRFFFGKNKVMASAMGKSPSDEYQPELHRLARVSGSTISFAVACTPTSKST